MSLSDRGQNMAEFLAFFAAGAYHPAMNATAHILRYREQDCPLTLAEGLAEYYAANANKIARPADLPPESAALFRNHDMCHVIFGLDTSFVDEAMADTRTMLSCDVGAAQYALYLGADPQAQKILKEVGVLAFVTGTLQAVPRICRAVVEAFRMKKKWPWEPPESFQARAIGELRAEFGIRVI